MGEAKRRRDARTRSERVIPERFLVLHGGEEGLRPVAMEVVAGDNHLPRHLALIDAAMDVIQHLSCAKADVDDENIRAIQNLGARLFNAAASSLKLAFTGYGQNAAAFQRDILETTFLLTYFQKFPDRLSRWRLADNATRKREFKQVTIRDELDKADGFTERRRALAYEALCSAASHPTVEGFALLRPLGSDMAHIGPFIDPNIFKRVIEELARVMVQAGAVFPSFFPGSLVAPIPRLHFLKLAAEWFAVHYPTGWSAAIRPAAPTSPADE